MHHTPALKSNERNRRQQQQQQQPRLFLFSFKIRKCDNGRHTAKEEISSNRSDDRSVVLRPQRDPPGKRERERENDI